MIVFVIIVRRSSSIPIFGVKISADARFILISVCPKIDTENKIQIEDINLININARY